MVGIGIAVQQKAQVKMSELVGFGREFTKTFLLELT